MMPSMYQFKPGHESPVVIKVLALVPFNLAVQILLYVSSVQNIFSLLYDWNFDHNMFECIISRWHEPVIKIYSTRSPSTVYVYDATPIQFNLSDVSWIQCEQQARRSCGRKKKYHTVTVTVDINYNNYTLSPFSAMVKNTWQGLVWGGQG